MERLGALLFADAYVDAETIFRQRPVQTPAVDEPQADPTEFLRTIISSLDVIETCITALLRVTDL